MTINAFWHKITGDLQNATVSGSNINTSFYVNVIVLSILLDKNVSLITNILMK